jgi:hypothetical protein
VRVRVERRSLVSVAIRRMVQRSVMRIVLGWEWRVSRVVFKESKIVERSGILMFWGGVEGGCIGCVVVSSCTVWRINIGLGADLWIRY